MHTQLTPEDQAIFAHLFTRFGAAADTMHMDDIGQEHSPPDADLVSRDSLAMEDLTRLSSHEPRAFYQRTAAHIDRY
ncbi:MAG: hypothetical protein H6981_07160 [Gammaproteobacteria bacterium]|nr:hypothetical protein [Gammaproteobacteria bacterium]